MACQCPQCAFMGQTRCTCGPLLKAKRKQESKRSVAGHRPGWDQQLPGEFSVSFPGTEAAAKKEVATLRDAARSIPAHYKNAPRYTYRYRRNADGQGWTIWARSK